MKNPINNQLVKLDNLKTLELDGDKAFEYLQGQLTCDVRTINDNTMLKCAMCNPKGRILALLDVIYWHKPYLILPEDLVDKISLNLNKKAIFSKVKVTTNNNIHVFGFYLQNKNDKIPFNAILPDTQYSATYTNEYYCYMLSPNLYIFLTTNTGASCLKTEFSSDQQTTIHTWHTLCLQQGIITINKDSSELFLPHRLNLHKTSCISFNKGCYVGQEIIARTQYRAKLKHTVKIIKIATDEELFYGKKIYTDTQEEIGEIIDFVQIINNNYLLAVSSINL